VPTPVYPDDDVPTVAVGTDRADGIFSCADGLAVGTLSASRSDANGGSWLPGQDSADDLVWPAPDGACAAVVQNKTTVDADGASRRRTPQVAHGSTASRSTSRIRKLLRLCLGSAPSRPAHVQTCCAISFRIDAGWRYRSTTMYHSPPTDLRKCLTSSVASKFSLP
jgi:hypothetical protein